MKQIDKNIPIPAVKTGCPYKYPWREMEIGDSFIFDGKHPNETASRVGARFGIKFTVRKENEAYRIWRTA